MNNKKRISAAVRKRKKEYEKAYKMYLLLQVFKALTDFVLEEAKQ